MPLSSVDSLSEISSSDSGLVSDFLENVQPRPNGMKMNMKTEL